MMTTVSSKGQIVLPAELRRRDGVKAGQEFDAKPDYEWNHDRPGDATVYVSDPLPADVVVMGNPAVDFWLRSSATDVDLETTLSEVRPDGNETYVQSGFGRAAMRKLAPGATPEQPEHTGYLSDAAPLPVGRWARMQIDLFPVAHIFRKGSRIRVSLHTPGGDRPLWSWVLLRHDVPPTVDIANDASRPSRVVLPQVSGLSGYPASLPPCPSLRGQPCRRFEPYTNAPAFG